MWEQLTPAPPDSILGLNEAFARDPNPTKINLSVGVFKDERGKTPILASVHEAERRLYEAAASRSYLSIDGLPSYRRLVGELLFGANSDLLAAGRVATLQTPGGTGGLRVAADLIHTVHSQATVWLSRPTWANHPAIFRAAGLQTNDYPYLNAAGAGLDLPGMLAALENARPGDVVCLHACCHNPSGVDPTLDDWRQVAAVLREHRLLPLVDFAYQGFGEGIDADAAGLRIVAAESPELLVCSSYSKNFGLYSERVGAMTIVAESPAATEAALSHAKVCVRTNYSNPPQHGAAIVATVLADAELRAQWEDEVAAMRNRIHAMRRLFVDTLRAKGAPRDFSFLAEQRGMFSFSGLTPLEVDRLKSEHAIYAVGNGRINVAGMTADNMDRLCAAIVAVLDS